MSDFLKNVILPHGFLFLAVGLLVLLILSGSILLTPGGCRRFLAAWHLPRWIDRSGRTPVTDPDFTALLQQHRDWIASGKLGQPPNLSGRDWRNRDFQQADLSNANLHAADLRGAKLGHTDLRCADLSYAILGQADLRRSKLAGAVFDCADLTDADLRDSIGLTEHQLAGTWSSGAHLSAEVATFSSLKALESAESGARNLSYTLLAACIYCGLTVAGTTDEALIKNSASLALPIVGTSVPIVQFFSLMPAVIAIGFIWTQYELIRAVRFATTLPATLPDGSTLGDRVVSWSFACLLATHLPRLRMHARPSDYYQVAFVGVAVWGIPVATVLLVWLRYLPRHDWPVSVWHIFICSLMIALSVDLLLQTFLTLRETPQYANDPGHQRKILGDLRRMIPIVLGLSLVAGYLSKTVIDFADCARYLASDPDKPDVPAAPLDIEQLRKERVTFSLLNTRTWGPSLIIGLGGLPFVDISRASVSEKPPSLIIGSERSQWQLVTGARLSQANLNFALARNAFLVNADLQGSQLFGADLSDADCRRASFLQCRLEHANLDFADLRDANFTEARMRHATLQNARLDHCLMEETQADWADLTGASLTEGEIRISNFRHARFSGADLQRARLSGDFTGAHFDGAKLQNADFSGATLTGAHFKGATVNAKTLKTMHGVPTPRNLTIVP